MSGFIRLNRSFFENAYWKQQRTYSFSEAWLDLIQSARFDEEPATIILPNGRELIIKRGQLRASLRFLADRWGWGVEKTQRFINKHIEKHEIERITEQGESVITLCNYDKYNPLSNTDPNTHQYTDQYTDRTPTSTKNKKEKKVKKDKKDIVCESIDDNNTYNTNWRENFEIYLSDLRQAYLKLLSDHEWVETQQRFNPNLNLTETLNKACVNYWATEAGWVKKKSTRSKTIDWRQTLTNAISQPMNKVYNVRANSHTQRESEKRESLDRLARGAAEYLFGSAG